MKVIVGGSGGYGVAVHTNSFTPEEDCYDRPPRPIDACLHMFVNFK